MDIRNNNYPWMNFHVFMDISISIIHDFMDIHLDILGFLWKSMHWLAMDSRSRIPRRFVQTQIYPVSTRSFRNVFRDLWCLYKRLNSSLRHTLSANRQICKFIAQVLEARARIDVWYTAWHILCSETAAVLAVHDKRVSLIETDTSSGTTCPLT